MKKNVCLICKISISTTTAGSQETFSTTENVVTLTPLASQDLVYTDQI